MIVQCYKPVVSQITKKSSLPPTINKIKHKIIINFYDEIEINF